MCKAAFVGIGGIKASRLIRKVLNFVSGLPDNRGKHDNHSKVADSGKNRVRKHIEMFTVRESHCS